MEFSHLKTAIVHDWLPLYGGAERVLEQMIKVLPHAEIFSLIESVPEGQRGFLQGRTVNTSLVQRLPWGKKAYRAYFPIMPLVIEQFDLSAYDLVISSSYSFAKGVITGPHQLHLCYCHSPVRYAWDLQHQYLNQSGLATGVRSWMIRAVLHYIRMWDVRTSNGVDAFAANSSYVARRIHKVYQRDAEVIFPPIATEAFDLQPKKSDYYVTASRMVPYKRLDILISAFARLPDRRLIVIGDGPDRKLLESGAPSNVTFLGHAEQDVLKESLENARAFLFAAEEDFGIVSVEAQACGTPVIAFSRGGSAETVVDRKTGIYFHEQTPEAVLHAIHQFEKMTFDPAEIRRHSETFSTERFRRNFLQWVTREYLEFVLNESRLGSDATMPFHAHDAPFR